MSLLGKLREERLAAEQPADPWLAPLQRVRGKVEFDGQERVTQPDAPGPASGASAQPHSRHLPASGEADGGAGLDGCAGPRPHAGRL